MTWTTNEDIRASLERARVAGELQADEAWKDWDVYRARFGAPPPEKKRQRVLVASGLPPNPTPDDWAAARLLFLFVADMAERTAAVAARERATAGELELTVSITIAAGNGFAARLAHHRGVKPFVMTGGTLEDMERRWLARRGASS